MHTCRKRRACTSGAFALHMSSRPAAPVPKNNCRRSRSGRSWREAGAMTCALVRVMDTQEHSCSAFELVPCSQAQRRAPVPRSLPHAQQAAQERQRACRATKMPSPASTCSPGTRCLGRASSCGRRGRGAAGGCACCRPGRRTCCEARRRRSAMVASTERGSPRSSSPLPVHIGAAAAAPPPSAFAGLVGLAARRSAAHTGGAASQRIAIVRARSFAGDYQCFEPSHAVGLCESNLNSECVNCKQARAV